MSLRDNVEVARQKICVFQLYVLMSDQWIEYIFIAKGFLFYKQHDRRTWLSSFTIDLVRHTAFNWTSRCNDEQTIKSPVSKPTMYQALYWLAQGLHRSKQVRKDQMKIRIHGPMVEHVRKLAVLLDPDLKPTLRSNSVKLGYYVAQRLSRSKLLYRSDEPSWYAIAPEFAVI